jgi:hypothetical protein
MKHSRLPLFLLLAVSVYAAVFMTCSDDGCGPGGCPRPDIENIWPNDDGRGWDFSLVQHWWGRVVCQTMYENEEDVPPIPSLDEIESMLRDHEIPQDFETVQGSYHIIFAGDSTSGSGVTAQALRESIYFAGGSLEPLLAGGAQNAFLARLMLARPDVREELIHRPELEGAVGDILRALPPDAVFTDKGDPAALPAPVEQIVSAPVLIHGGVWKKTEEWIGTYGDVDTMLAYKFLEDDYSPGHEFTFQLVPSLASDVFLHCRVLPRRIVWVGGRPYPNAVDCLYVIDYGVAEMHSIPGVRYCRVYDYGTVTYAPTAGPIHSYERALVEAGNAASLGVGEKTLELTRTNPGPAAGD